MRPVEETVLDIQSHKSDKPTVSHGPLPGEGVVRKALSDLSLDGKRKYARMYHSSEEIEVTYSAVLTVCSNGMVKGTEYKAARKKIRQGYEEIHDKSPDHREKKAKADREIEKKNLIRTRDQLIAYASENEALWASFVTLTFRENLTDLTEANRCFENWVRQVRRDRPEFAYLCVPEFQKRGAVHYHLLTNLECGDYFPQREPLRTWNPEKKKAYMQEYYDLPHWPHGYSNAQDLACMDDSFNCALYVTKYLFKDVDQRLFGRKKIMKSQNLRRPTKYYLNSETFHGAITYLIEKGYPISLYSFEPRERYQVAHTAYFVKERIASDDREIIESIVSNAYSELNA